MSDFFDYDFVLLQLLNVFVFMFKIMVPHDTLIKRFYTSIFGIILTPQPFGVHFSLMLFNG